MARTTAAKRKWEENEINVVTGKDSGKVAAEKEKRANKRRRALGTLTSSGAAAQPKDTIKVVDEKSTPLHSAEKNQDAEKVDDIDSDKNDVLLASDCAQDLREHLRATESSTSGYMMDSQPHIMNVCVLFSLIGL